MIADFLTPVPEEFQNLLSNHDEGKLPIELDFFQGGELPDIGTGDLVFFGVCESRANKNNLGADEGPNRVRQAFFNLHRGAWKARLVDLGNISAGESIPDTYSAHAAVMEYCLKRGAITICIGGSHDLTYSQYLGYQNLEQAVNLTLVDREFDLAKLEETPGVDSYMSHIILKQPNFLFNYAHLGFQSYYVNAEVKHLFDKMNFDSIRLGLLKGRLDLVEPVLRDTDLLSIDMNAVKASDFSSTHLKGPNGFSGDEICGIARYAGISDKLSSFGVYEYNPEMDPNGLGAELIAQMIWYFIDGFNERKADYPFTSKNDYTKYNVMSENQELIFFKSPKSGRWWIEVPYPQNLHTQFKRHALIPCSYDDYQEALAGDIPDKWWRAFYKLQ